MAAVHTDQTIKSDGAHELGLISSDEKGHAANNSESGDDDVSAKNEDQREYPHGLTLAAIILGLCLAIFLVALDQTIIATAIPKITNEFRALNDVGWYGSAYLLTSCALQPTWGKVYQNFSVKWFFIVAVSLFEFGSLICGVAPNSVTLIIGRAIAGLGASGIFSGALTILAYSIPLEKRPAYMGMIGAMFGIASIAGPLLGGVFTEKATWRWCFYINLPLGVITIGSIVWLLHIKQDIPNRTFKEKIAQIDFLGASFLLPGVVCLLLALQWGGSTYPWKSSKIIGLFVGFGLFAIIFIAIQLKIGDRATIPPRILFKRTILSSSLYGFFFGGAFFILAYYIPIYFQAIQGSSAVRSGIQLLPLMLAVVFSSILSGVLITKIGYYTPILIFGAALTSIGVGLITTYDTNTSTGLWVSYQVLAGLGAGCSFQIPIIAVQTVLDLVDVPTGSALIQFFQTLGGAIFIAIAQALFTNKLSSNLERDLTDIPVAAVIQSGATAFRQFVPAADLPIIVRGYASALSDSYKASVAAACFAFVCACFVEFRSIKGKKIEMGGAA